MADQQWQFTHKTKRLGSTKASEDLQTKTKNQVICVVQGNGSDEAQTMLPQAPLGKN